MQIKQLEYLLKIVECGSITKAASELYISQPNLTKAIHQLEEEFDIKILARKPRGVDLTLDGKNFVYYAKNVVSSIQALTDNCRKEHHSTHSRLFLAAQQLDFVYDIFVKVFLQNHDRPVHYNLVETDRNNVVHQVLNGDVNCGLFVRNNKDAKTFLWDTNAKELELHVLDQGSGYVCVGPKSPYYHRDSLTTAEAEINTQVMLDMEDAARQNLYFDNTGAKFNRDQAIFFNTIDACKRFLLQTDAVLYLSKWSRGYFDYPRFRILPLVPSRPGEEPIVNELIWTRRSNTPLNPTEKMFLNYLLEYLSTLSD